MPAFVFVYAFAAIANFGLAIYYLYLENFRYGISHIVIGASLTLMIGLSIRLQSQNEDKKMVVKNIVKASHLQRKF